jgi:hypothetical protein
MEQLKTMEYESRKASLDVLKPRNIYRFVSMSALRTSHLYPHMKYPSQSFLLEAESILGP